MKKEMTLQLLVAAMGKDALELAKEMNIGSDAIIVSQGEEYSYQEVDYKGKTIKYFSMAERGVGLSRNHALLRADHDISVFADEDIVYTDDYAEQICKAFEDHPEADMLMFNVEASQGRETYHIEKFGRVRSYNCARYSTYSVAVKTEKIHKRNITFSLLFGGGAKYSNGEDSLFISECIRKGMKVYKVPVLIGREQEGESTWFSGYNRKFFFDRGVLYHYLYGGLKTLMSLRFLLAHKAKMCNEIPWKEAFKIMREGIKEAEES